MDKLQHLVRQSKFRHVYGEELNARFEDIHPSSVSSEGQLVKSNGVYVAFAWDSSSPCLALLSLSEVGRVSHDHPMVKGPGNFLDFDFNPFHDQQILTAAENATLALWEVPEGPVCREVTTPLVQLQAHEKKATLVAFNPCAAYVCASASADNTVKVWSLEGQSCVSTFGPAGDPCLCIHWDPQGSLLASTWRNKVARVLDPRTGKSAQEFQAHEGSKAAKVCWVRSGESVLTCGFSRLSDRQYALWDLRNYSRPTAQESIDQSSGVLMPHFDPDTGLLFLSGKGDGNIRYYEIDSTPPFVHSIDSYKSRTPCKGVSFVPKRRVDVAMDEVARAVKLTNSTVEQVSIRVPRKAEGFQADIYPDCTGVSPGLRVREWLQGVNRVPPKVSMRDLSQLPAKGVLFEAVAGLLRPVLSSALAAVPAAPAAPDSLREQLAEVHARLAALEAKNAQLSEENATLRQTLADYNMLVFGSPGGE